MLSGDAVALAAMDDATVNVVASLRTRYLAVHGTALDSGYARWLRETANELVTFWRPPTFSSEHSQRPRRIRPRCIVTSLAGLLDEVHTWHDSAIGVVLSPAEREGRQGRPRTSEQALKRCKTTTGLGADQR
jgi:hypothetical protein